MPTTINVAIADEITLLRNALKKSLVQNDGLKVVFDAHDAPELFEKLPQHQVDVLLLDAFIQKGDTREVVLFLKDKYPGVNLLIISLYTELKMVSDLLDLGINGFVSKSADLAELTEAIYCASQSSLYKNKVVTDTFYWKANNRLVNPYTPKEIYLSGTERKIIQLLWEEKNTQEIASTIFASVSTVEKIKQKLKQKIGSRSIIGIIKYAIKERIIPFQFPDPEKTYISAKQLNQ